MNILIRADANNRIGSGHFMRCFALSQSLKSAGHRIVFLTDTQNPFFLNKAIRENFIIKNLGRTSNMIDDAKKTLEAAEEINASWIITDGYHFDTKYQITLKSSGRKLFCIDDTAESHFVSDIVLNQNYEAEKRFKYSKEDYTRLLLGIRYLLLRKEYQILPDRKRNNKTICKNVMLTFGGSDINNETMKFLNYLNNKNFTGLNFNVVLGPDYEYLFELEKFASNAIIRINILHSVENLIPVIKGNDIAISSAGSMVWEMAYFGTPMILIPTADNQNSVIKPLSDNAMVIQHNPADKSENFIRKFEMLIHDKSKRENLSSNISVLLKNYNPSEITKEFY